MKRLRKKLKDIIVSITFAEPKEYDTAKQGFKSGAETAKREHTEKKR